jgi:hypothetical protein
MSLFVVLSVAFLFVCGNSASYAQRNDPTKNASKKDKAEEGGLTYDTAIGRYGPPDQEKQMKDGSLVCTWTQTFGIQGQAREGLAGGNTMKMVIFFSKDGVMTDRKFRNCPVFFSDSVFRLK